MTDYFRINITESDIQGVSSLALAHIGDAVYELMVRSYLISSGIATAGALHKTAVKYVSAVFQSRGAEKILPNLTDGEHAVFKRGRNTKVNSVPKGASIKQYHNATALEALFGWLYIHERKDRLNELFEIIMEVDHAS